MHQLFETARFSEAGRIYDEAIQSGESSNGELDLLKAHTLFAAGRQNEALSFLLNHDPRRRDPQIYARWVAFVGNAYARLRDFESADRYFNEVSRRKVSVTDSAFVAYYRTRRYLLEHRIEDAWRTHGETLKESSLYGKIRAEHLRSFIFSQEERYEEQERSLLKVLALIGKRRAEYLEEWYWAVHTLAALARELGGPEAMTTAQREVDASVEWSPDFAINRFQALKAVGWCNALRGDQLSCFRYLRAAQETDVHLVWKAILLLDRSYFASSIGESQWSRNEMQAAEDLMSTIDWNQCHGEERIALLLLAELLAPIDNAKAAQYLEKFCAEHKINSPSLHFSSDNRMEAMMNYTRGIVTLFANKKQTAESALKRAWGTFDRIGYGWRAARAAIALYESSGKSRWLHLAEEKLDAFSDSWLMRNFETARKTTLTRPAISPMQGRVLELLCRGFSTADIAAELGRSSYTVRNHIKLLFKAYKVRTRHALVAAASNASREVGYSSGQGFSSV